MENWPVRKKKKRYRGLILALLMLVPAGYIGVQMVQVLRTNYQTQTAVAYSMSDVVRCDGMLAMDETVIPYEGAGVLGYQVNNGERVSAGTQVARLFADEASAQNRTLSEKLTEELSVLEKSQAGAAADVEALMNQNQQATILPIDRKMLLSIREAAEYSNIGINKIDGMLRSPNCPFVLFVGSKKLVKRKEFEQYISQALVI